MPAACPMPPCPLAPAPAPSAHTLAEHAVKLPLSPLSLCCCAAVQLRALPFDCCFFLIVFLLFPLVVAVVPIVVVVVPIVVVVVVVPRLINNICEA